MRARKAIDLTETAEERFETQLILMGDMAPWIDEFDDFKSACLNYAVFSGHIKLVLECLNFDRSMMNMRNLIYAFHDKASVKTAAQRFDMRRQGLHYHMNKLGLKTKDFKECGLSVERLVGRSAPMMASSGYIHFWYAGLKDEQKQEIQEIRMRRRENEIRPPTPSSGSPTTQHTPSSLS